MKSIGIKSIQQLYEYKILFLKQIKRNSFTKGIYETLLCKYEQIRPTKESYINILNQICIKYGFEIEFINLKDILNDIRDHYINDNLDINLIVLLKNILALSGAVDFNEEKRMMLSTLLTIESET